MKIKFLAAGALLLATACTRNPPIFTDQALHVVGPSQVEIGEYIADMGGCHDCHTPGWSQSGGNVPKEQLLIGGPVGFSGPWGTSYSRNLRQSVQSVSSEEWVETMKHRQGLPPMPWMVLNHMSEDDLAALYAFIYSLGEGGEDVPAPLPPGSVPQTPHIWFEPLPPGSLPSQP